MTQIILKPDGCPDGRRVLKHKAPRTTRIAVETRQERRSSRGRGSRHIGGIHTAPRDIGAAVAAVQAAAEAHEAAGVVAAGVLISVEYANRALCKARGQVAHAAVDGRRAGDPERLAVVRGHLAQARAHARAQVVRLGQADHIKDAVHAEHADRLAAIHRHGLARGDVKAREHDVPPVRGHGREAIRVQVPRVPALARAQRTRRHRPVLCTGGGHRHSARNLAGLERQRVQID